MKFNILPIIDNPSSFLSYDPDLRYEVGRGENGRSYPIIFLCVLPAWHPQRGEGRCGEGYR